jgi:phage terminase small subunit
MKKSEQWPGPPEHLSEKAKELFVCYVGRTIFSLGQIALFIRGLEAMDEAAACRRIIQRDGLSITSERSRMTRQHPLLNTEREATAQMMKIWKELSLHINRQQSKNGFGYENIA